MSIQNIVFDMGGVLIDFDPERMIRDNGLLPFRDVVMEKVFGSTHWTAMDMGTQTVEEAVGNMLADLPPQIHTTVRHMILDRETQMPILTEMTPIINTLWAQGYRLFVLSNCAAWFHEFKKTIPSIEKFSGFVISADYGVCKPDPQIYRIFLETYHLEAQTCFFIDDSPANTDAAAALGFTAHCFRDRDFARLRAALAAL